MSRITSRGYVLQKSEFTPEKLLELKNDLSLTPKDNHVVKIVKGQEKCVIVYRENEQKIYIPRFYGLKTFGPSHKYEIKEGDSVDIPFTQ